MQKIVLLLVALLLPLAFTSCGGEDHMSLLKDQQSQMEKLVNVLEGVTDQASAEAAKGDLESIGKKMAETAKRGEALGDPSEADMQKAMEAAEEMLPLTQKMAAEMMRIATIPGAADLLKDLQSTLGSL